MCICSYTYKYIRIPTNKYPTYYIHTHTYTYLFVYQQQNTQQYIFQYNCSFFNTKETNHGETAFNEEPEEKIKKEAVGKGQ